MKQGLNYSKYIDRYLEDDMSKEEIAWFEKEMHTNNELLEEVQLSKTIMDTMKEKDVYDLHSSIDELFLRKKEESVPATKTTNRRTVAYISSGVAAAVIIALLFVTNITKQDSFTESTSLFKEYYAPIEATNNFRSGVDVNHELQVAMKHYTDKKYEKAALMFEEVLETDSKLDGVKLYAGISYMEMGEYENANRLFKNLISENNLVFRETASWYYGLSLLRSDSIEKATMIFDEISNNGGYYSDEASEVIEILSK